jgi:hypothetical protein
MTTVTDIYYLPVPKHNEDGKIVGWAHIQYLNRETTYLFRAAELEIDIIDRDGASKDDVRLALERHYKEEGIAGEIVSLKDEDGLNF